MDFCQTLALRTSIVAGLIASVLVILYYTPLPDQYPQSCSRPCHELDWPMICRVKLTLERFQTLGRACKDCPGNQTDCYLNGCITVDGHSRGILTVNRQFPGPTLEVCQYDIILVDVVNRIPGQSFGVHWRGQAQIETPYMDGVPMITQCPIPSLTTYQYKFRASESGTHMWQVNTGDELLDTLFGPLIVKKPESKEIHRKLYDTDNVANTVVIHNWNPQKSNVAFEDETSKTKLLINGKTQENGVPPSVFKITSGKRHRFRVIYMGGTTNCPIRFSIDHHKLLIIALDGHSIEPQVAMSATMFPGERLDFVLHANQKTASYYLRAEPIECPNLVETLALIQYDGVQKTIFDLFSNKMLEDGLEVTEVRTVNNENSVSTTRNLVVLCLRDIHATEKMPEELSSERPDFKFYFFYNSTLVSSLNTFNTSIIGIRDTVQVPQTNNLTMILPSSPLVSQAHQISSDAFCNSNALPQRCQDNADNVCECIHVVEIPLKAVVELILVNQDKSSHVFHLHGYSFRVIGGSSLPAHGMTPEIIKQLDGANKLVKRNFFYPVIKDTLALDSNSLAVLRFKADNPGYWMLDEENSSHWFKGMSLVFKVGTAVDLSPIPEDFPKCGDWVGPEYFLA